MSTPPATTQRTGTALANSNCRMASGCTGIHFQTGGKVYPTPDQMRARSGDTEGGTSSDDLAKAWSSYGESLRVRNGQDFDAVLGDLAAGRLVMLDVWVDAMDAVCVSGSGGYGHTVGVLGPKVGSKWNVMDPWCSPGKWVYVNESQLRAGAEAWGKRVFSTAGDDPEYVEALRTADDARAAAVIARVNKHLMTRTRLGVD